MDDVDEDEMVELPGGIDQLETLMEEYENSKEVEDTSKLVFSKHSGSVFCCSLHSSEGLVATGGEDDKVILSSHRSILSILDSHCSILTILASHCSILSMLASQWSYSGFAGAICARQLRGPFSRQT